MNLTNLAVKRPVATTMVFIALSLLGAVSYYLLPVQLLPNLVFQQLQMVLWLPGASPEEIEQELVIPAEGAIASLEGVKSIYSSVSPERGSISISFDFGTDMRYAYIKLEQKAAALRKQMPEQTFIDVIKYETSDFTSILMNLVVSGPGDINQLRNFADDKIVQRLSSLDGVVGITVYGGEEDAVEVIVDEKKCEAFGVPLFTVGQSIATFNRRTEYLGDVTEDGRRYFVSLTGRVSSIADLRELPLGDSGVRLKDIADVRAGLKDKERISRIDGQQAVMLLIRKDNAANMLRVARKVHREIARLNGELAGHGVEIKTVFDAAKMVQDAIHRVEQLALFGVTLALGVLLIFLKRLRTVSIILVAIPVSLLITFNVMYYADLSINLLSLLGFAFAIGLLVDNGVVVIENTFRRAARTRDGITAAIEGTKEVSMPIVAMTGTTLIAFLPIYFLVENDFRLIMEEFVYSIASPLLVSVFVSMTLVPMLAARTIDYRVASARKHNRLLEVYVVVLKAVLRHRTFTMVMTILFFFFTLIACLPFIASQQEFREPTGRLECNLRFPRGTSIETADRLTAKLEAICKELPDVKMIEATASVGTAKVAVQFLDPKERSVELDIGSLKNQIRNQVETVEGIGTDRLWFSGSGDPMSEGVAMSSMDAFGGSGPREYVQVRGQDDETLEKLALQIEQRLKRAFGDRMAYVSTINQPGAPELEIRGNRSRLAGWGLSMADLTGVVWLARRGGDAQVVPFRTGDRDIDILVRLKDSKERTLDDLEHMRLRVPDGNYIELADVADVKISESPRDVRRRDRQHEVRVNYAFREDLARSARRLKVLQGQVDDVMGAMQMPQGYSMKIVHKEDDDHSMRWAMISAVICVFLLLAALFEDLGAPLCVMAAFPLAIIGVCWGLAFTESGLASPMAWAGLVMLVGVVVNDAILTLGQARRLIGMGYGRNRAVLQAGRNRLRPVIMTTATTVLAMLPLAIRRGGESEIWPVFAITVVFGLIASTFGTLVFIPAMYLSLRDIGSWLKSIGFIGIGIALGATAALFYFGFMRGGWIESWIFRTVLAPAAFFAVAAIVWTVIRIVTAVTHTSVFEGEDIHISINNLTKIFGADKHMVRDWKLKRRREKGMRERGEPVVNKSHVREDLVWKIPLFGLLIYFHIYFENPFWLFVTACTTWFSLYDLVRSAGLLIEGDDLDDMGLHRSRLRRVFWTVALRLPAVALVCYFYFRLRAELWFAIFFLVVALILHWLNRLAAKARRGEIDVAGRSGMFAALRRVALRMPVVAGVKPQVKALTGVNLEIGKGMFGLLGPNGAGKTTLMRILCNIYEPTRGCIEINGRNVRGLRSDVQPIIGYLPQHFGLHQNYTVWNYLNHFALLGDIFDKDEREALVERAIREVNLEERKHDKIKSLSGGMKQRVGIAQTLLHLPKIIVVDEPTAGLDPMERIRFRNLLAELGKDRVVVFSTHITEDVMSSCHDLAVLNEGRVVFRGAPGELQRMAVGKVREAVVDAADVAELTERVHVVSQVTEAEGVRVRFIVTDEAERVGEQAEPTLEDAYLWLLRTAEGCV